MLLPYVRISAISVPVSLSTGIVPSVGHVITQRSTSILTVACYYPKEHEYSYCNAPGWYCFMYVGGSVHSHSALFTGAMLCVCVLLKNRNRAPQHVNTSGLPQTFTFKDSNATAAAANAAANYDERSNHQHTDNSLFQDEQRSSRAVRARRRTRSSKF